MTMIERVARALAITHWNYLTDWETELSPVERDYWLEHARIAIEAMREPSPEMLEAAMNAGEWPMCDGEILARWPAAIDAALQCEVQPAPSQNTGVITDPPPVSDPP